MSKLDIAENTTARRNPAPGPAQGARVPAALPPKLEIKRQGALLQFTLNRPEVLNAFDEDMRKAIADELPRVARNPEFYIVALTSSSPRAFCAGGDVRALVALAKRDLAMAKLYFANEYALDWALECFMKPSVSFINGMCMGSGAGLTCFNTHRIAGENYSWAMPETAIGLFPDVGIAHVLARMPWPVGLYLGLTGRRIGGADAHWLGLATHCIPSQHHDAILAALAAAEPVDPILDALHAAEGKAPLQAEMGLIRDFFSEDSLEKIIAKLRRSAGASEDWGGATLAELESRSPISLAITDRHIRTCRDLDLRSTLIQDYRIACRCLAAPDFGEGVRAALVDKDQSPNWSPAKLADVSAALVAAYFEPLGSEDLVLPLRAEMQNVRV